VGIVYNPIKLPGSARLVLRRVSKIVDEKMIMPINYIVARHVFRKILKVGKGNLSSAALRESLLQRLGEQVEILRDKYETGHLWR
jgi:hypothetical protein